MNLNFLSAASFHQSVYLERIPQPGSALGRDSKKEKNCLVWAKTTVGKPEVQGGFISSHTLVHYT